MSYYSPPVRVLQTYAPIDYSGKRFNSTSTVDTSGYLLYPNAQGAVMFDYDPVSGNQAALGNNGLSITTNNSTIPTGIAFGAAGFAYDNGESVSTISWDNLDTKIQAVGALSAAPNPTTLAVNNAISVQNGETPATQVIELVSDASGNRLLLNGYAGNLGDVLVSGGDGASLVWGAGGGSVVGTLAEVLNNGNVASWPILMSGYDVSGCGVFNGSSLVLGQNVQTENSITIGTSDISYMETGQIGVSDSSKTIGAFLGTDPVGFLAVGDASGNSTYVRPTQIEFFDGQGTTIGSTDTYLAISTPPELVPSLTSTAYAWPVYLNGIKYFLPLFSSP